MKEITLRLSDSDLSKLMSQLICLENVDNVSIKVTEALLTNFPADIKYLKGELT